MSPGAEEPYRPRIHLPVPTLSVIKPGSVVLSVEQSVPSSYVVFGSSLMDGGGVTVSQVLIPLAGEEASNLVSVLSLLDNLGILQTTMIRIRRRMPLCGGFDSSQRLARLPVGVDIANGVSKRRLQSCLNVPMTEHLVLIP
jgi:hypothetical protein